MKQKRSLTQSVYFFIPLLFLLAKCKPHSFYLSSQKKELIKQSNDDWIISKRLYVYPGKTYTLHNDGSSKPYPIIREQNDTTLIIIEINKNLKNPLPDSGQSFKLYIPVPNPLTFKNKTIIIPPRQVLFGLQAFMAGAGYKKLNKGDFVITHKNNKIILSITLKDKFLSEFSGTYNLPIKK